MKTYLLIHLACILINLAILVLAVVGDVYAGSTVKQSLRSFIWSPRPWVVMVLLAPLFCLSAGYSVLGTPFEALDRLLERLTVSTK